jgi:hypothetical protein
MKIWMFSTLYITACPATSQIIRSTHSKTIILKSTLLLSSCTLLIFLLVSFLLGFIQTLYVLLFPSFPHTCHTPHKFHSSWFQQPNIISWRELIMEHTITYHTIPYHTTPYHTTPYHTISYHTIPYHTIPIKPF